LTDWNMCRFRNQSWKGRDDDPKTNGVQTDGY
jgi:hypothetical protein